MVNDQNGRIVVLKFFNPYFATVRLSHNAQICAAFCSYIHRELIEMGSTEDDARRCN